MAIRKLAFGLLLLFCQMVTSAAPGQEHGIARINAGESRIEDFGSNLHVELALSRPVLWRVFTLDAPRRLVVDFSEVDFRGTDLGAIVASDGVSWVEQRRDGANWTQLVIHLSHPLRIETAGLAPQGHAGAVLKLQLAPTTAAEFTEEAGPPEDPGPEPESAPVPKADAEPAATGTYSGGLFQTMARALFGAGPDRAG